MIIMLAATSVHAQPASSPFHGAPLQVPGTIEVEDFDEGGEGIAYHDSDAVNTTGAYRTTGVDIQSTTDTGGGYNVSYIVAGEWLEYSINVATAGSIACGSDSAL